MDGTSELDNSIYEVFDVTTGETGGPEEEHMDAKLNGETKSVTFSDVLKILRTRQVKPIKKRPLIGEAVDGLVSVEERTFGFNANYPDLTMYSEKPISGEGQQEKKTETTEARKARRALANNTDQLKQDKLLLDYILEIGDVWYQSQVFEHDLKTEPIVKEDIKRMRESFDASIEWFLEGLQEIVSAKGKSLQRYSTLTLGNWKNLIPQLTIQKYWIRAKLGKDEKGKNGIEKLVQQACQRILTDYIE